MCYFFYGGLKIAHLLRITHRTFMTISKRDKIETVYSFFVFLICRSFLSAFYFFFLAFRLCCYCCCICWVSRSVCRYRLSWNFDVLVLVVLHLVVLEILVVVFIAVVFGVVLLVVILIVFSCRLVVVWLKL